MCGADKLRVITGMMILGSPPRVRSRPVEPGQKHHRRGITSACAEQTSTATCAPATRPDHLRVCGADALFAIANAPPLGSPPRVRSRPEASGLPPVVGWITSACAEQTDPDAEYLGADKDHLRVCGADSFYKPQGEQVAGSPPRVRSRHIKKRFG